MGALPWADTASYSFPFDCSAFGWGNRDDITDLKIFVHGPRFCTPCRVFEFCAAVATCIPRVDAKGLVLGYGDPVRGIEPTCRCRNDSVANAEVVSFRVEGRGGSASKNSRSSSRRIGMLAE